MSTDWKALCAELTREVELYAEDRGDLIPDCVDRARAALAAEPPDGCAETMSWIGQAVARAIDEQMPEAVEPIPLAEPVGEPVPPAEGEQRHPTPVPVSERLPGASHVYFEFVISDADDCTQAGGIAPTYAQALSEGQHYLAQCQQDGPHTLELRRVEVLPPGALPLWRVMQEAGDEAAAAAVMNFDGFAIAAEIRALRDWLVPEEAEPEPGCRFEQRHIIWRREQRLRALLTDEADRAECGEVEA